MMAPEIEERLALAFEAIAESLAAIATVLERESALKYPYKKAPREPLITYIPTDEERLKQDQGQTGEATTAEWTTLGPRERAFVEKEKSDRSGTDGAEPRDRSCQTRH